MLRGVLAGVPERAGEGPALRHRVSDRLQAGGCYLRVKPPSVALAVRPAGGDRDWGLGCLDIQA